MAGLGTTVRLRCVVTDGARHPQQKQWTTVPELVLPQIDKATSAFSFLKVSRVAQRGQMRQPRPCAMARSFFSLEDRRKLSEDEGEDLPKRRSVREVV